MEAQIDYFQFRELKELLTDIRKLLQYQVDELEKRKASPPAWRFGL